MEKKFIDEKSLNFAGQFYHCNLVKYFQPNWAKEE